MARSRSVPSRRRSRPIVTPARRRQRRCEQRLAATRLELAVAQGRLESELPLARHDADALAVLAELLERFGAVELTFARDVDGDGPTYALLASGETGRLRKARPTLTLALLAAVEREPRQQCRRCKVAKPLSLFTTHPDGDQGRFWICRQCDRARGKTP